MTRVKSFAAPHKGLRNSMARFSLCLGSIDVGNPSQLSGLKDLGHELFTLLTHHAHTENEYTLKLLEERVKGASEHDRNDHQRLERIQQTLEDQLSGLTGNESPDDMHLFYLAFSQFQSQYLDHIFEEETVTELLLQHHFTDQELIQNRSSVMQSFEVPMLLLWLNYMIPAQPDEENLAMLSGLKANAPKEVMDRVMTTIQQELGADRFQRLAVRLQDQS